MGSETMLDPTAAGDAADALSESADEVNGCADRAADRVFTTGHAGRNYGVQAEDLSAGLGRLADTLRAWSGASSTTAASIRAAVDASVTADTANAARVGES